MIKAVDNVTFELAEKEILGLAGESGSGKSTLAFSLLRIVPPPGRIVGGEVVLDGKDLLKMSETEIRKIRGREISMVFQSAMNALNPMFKVKDQIIEAILTHSRVSPSKAMTKAKELIEIVGIDASRLNSYPFELSGGMKQRVLMAIALANLPSIVIADEPTTALDVITQAQIITLIKDLQEKHRLSVLYITHDIPVLAEICDELAIMYAGKIMEYGSIKSLIEKPKHPYTQALMKSLPKFSQSRRKRLNFITGTLPDPINLPPGCRFHPRCPYAKEVCHSMEPVTVEVGKRHYVACHLY